MFSNVSYSDVKWIIREERGGPVTQTPSGRGILLFFCQYEFFIEVYFAYDIVI